MGRREEDPVSENVAPILRLVEGQGVAPEAVLVEVRDHLREQAIRLPHSDEWREALVGIAADLSQALELRAPELGQLGPSH